MKQQTIYEVTVVPIGSLNSIRAKEPVYSYFSNLRKCVEQLSAALIINHWKPKMNYTAVYRAIKTKGRYVEEYAVGGNKVFRINIIHRTINPSLSLLGIEENPLIA
jgi:heterodisulfide reductase subunit A-like polyferredoxin